MRNIEAISTAALLKMQRTPDVGAELDRRGEMLAGGISRRPDRQTGDLFEGKAESGKRKAEGAE